MTPTIPAYLSLLAMAALMPGCANSHDTRTDAISTAAAAGPSVDAPTAEALREALADERLAQRFYEAVMQKYGRVVPFANVVRAEQRHEQMVTDLMLPYDVAVPEATAESPTAIPQVPATFAESCATAAELERKNIAMYDRFLAFVTEPDIRAGFESLRSASLNRHLPAFERWAGGKPAGRTSGASDAANALRP